MSLLTPLETSRNSGLRVVVGISGGTERSDQLESEEAIVRSVLGDVDLGFRQLRKRPIWSLAIVGVLAIGIAGNTTMYSAFEAWVLRPLDFHEPASLVALYETQPEKGRTRLPVAPQTLGDWIAEQQVFEELSAFRRSMINLSDDAQPVRLDGAQVAASLFPMLGKEPALGRNFSEDEDRPGQVAPVALISHALWRERYSGSPDILGQTLRLDGRVHEVVGVMPPGFAFPEWGQVWTPLGLDLDGGSRSDRTLSVVGRLLPETTVETADSALESIAARVAQRHPETNRGWSAEVMTLRASWVPAVIEVALAASMGAAVLVLLVICANVGGLIIAQATARQRELALRSALGASRRRLVQQNVVEVTVLALLGGVLGLPLAQLAVRDMLGSVPVDPPYLFAMTFSPWAGAYTVLMALVAGLACGWAPFTRRSGLGGFESLKSGGRAGAYRQLVGARKMLVVGELALSTALVVGALLVVKSFWQQQSSASGFRTDGVVSADLALAGVGLETLDERREAIRRLQAALAVEPAFESSGVATRMVMWPSEASVELEAQGQPVVHGEGVPASFFGTTRGYLDTLAINVVAGRTFTAGEEENGAGVTLVSSSLAEQLWPGQDPVGRLVKRTQDDSSAWLTVVGVVGDVSVGRDMVDFGGQPKGQFYAPWAAAPSAAVSVAVLGQGSAESSAEALRSVVGSVLPGVPVAEVLTIEESLLRVGWVSRFFGLQLSQYAMFAILIAAIGLYGLLADSVHRRSAELATRAALGANRQNLVDMILREAMKLGGLGIGLGLVLAVASTRWGASMLVGVSVLDPVVFSAVALTLLAVTVLAALIPALRASRSDPALALRAD